MLDKPRLHNIHKIGVVVDHEVVDNQKLDCGK